MQEVSLLLHPRQGLKTQEIRQHFQIAPTKLILRLHIQVDQDMDLVDHRVHLLQGLRLELQVTVAIHPLVQHQTMGDHHHIQVGHISFHSNNIPIINDKNEAKYKSKLNFLNLIVE